MRLSRPRGHIPGLIPKRRVAVLVFGIILLLLGLIFGVSILWTIGLIAVVIGGVLWIAGASGHQVGSRRHYY
jgi:hypothetical protein